MSYISNTEDDRQFMRQKIGVRSFDELIESIPNALRLKRTLDIPALSEMELLSEIEIMAGRNRQPLVCFAGGGVYDHFIPSAIRDLVGRSEFATAYTPYQAEVAQGTLQVIYEFQTHICRLTGMDVANASMYDGASAAAEAVIVSTRVTNRRKVLISETVNPLYRRVIRTYLSGRDLEVVEIPRLGGVSDLERLQDLIDDDTAGVLLSQPNFFGLLEEIQPVCDAAHKVGARVILAVDPIAQALLKTPGEYGVDIVVGEGQPFGLSLAFGGPLLGFFAARKDLIRYLPGRIAARTTDVDGKTGFVLTLQTREQHIRREKATSNICTNQALCATTATVYLSLMGKAGLKQVALLSAEKAQKLSQLIGELDGFEPYFKGPFVREFAVRTPVPARDLILLLMKEYGILSGIDAGRWFSDLDNCLIVATTEKRTTADISSFVDACKIVSTGNVLSRLQS